MKDFLVVLGGGESGVGAAILGKEAGFKILVSDAKEIKDKYKQVLLNNRIDFEENGHSEEVFKADLVVKSPGIPEKIEVIQKMRKLGIPIVSEIEFASNYTGAKLIAVTGSNGKTTTATLVHHLLKEELNVGLAGNIGESWAKMITEQDPDYWVLEVSSFQLDDIMDFKPHIAILTNITPDHLDRYENDFSKYIEAKFRITEN
ncbi:MAG: Mur ligase family protein, partial [Flavobacteriaceae bacterium]|nr:Mur ligase family protein [Flavobacteriaceae bacterium]